MWKLRPEVKGWKEKFKIYKAPLGAKSQEKNTINCGSPIKSIIYGRSEKCPSAEDDGETEEADENRHLTIDLLSLTSDHSSSHNKFE